MKLRVRKDWKYFLTRAWSMRMAILTAISTTFPLFVTAIPTVWFATLTMALAILTALAGVTSQPNMDRRKQDVPVSPDRRKE